MHTLLLFNNSISDQLFTLFELVTGRSSIGYAKGQEWRDRKQWIHGSLKGPILESYLPTFIKVNVRCILTVFTGSNLMCCEVKNVLVVLYVKEQCNVEKQA